MITPREALDAILSSVSPLAIERVGLLDALGRALAEEVVSTRDVPAHANSAMDGYAVRAEDVTAAPARLRVVGIAAAGAVPPALGAGQAIKIMTGGMVPGGADTVVKVEDTDGGDESVEIRVAPAPRANVRYAGEDVRIGDRVLEAGRTLVPADLGLLSSVGRTLLAVHRVPSVAIVSTGNELVEADRPVGPAQIVNSNAYALAAAVREAGAVPVMLPIARDRPESIREAFREAARCDAIVSTGGVSVGDFDYVKSVMDELGVERLFWKVAQKPGKPLTYGLLAGRPYFGLPGNPVSALVCFYLYARPALRRMAGHEAIHLPSVVATLAEELRTAEDLTEFVRVRVERDDRGFRATSTGTQSSGVLSSMSQGRGLLVSRAGLRDLRAGETFPVILFEGIASGAALPPF